jgi:transglutaminase-like putative cysteine protease
MRIAVRHHTTYRYSSAVFLGPQVLRLKPRSDASQQVVSFDVTIQPSPNGLTENTGAEGNHELLAWFQGPADVLEIDTYAVVDTLRPNAFNFIWLGDHHLPLDYGDELNAALLPYRFVEPLADSVQQLASRIAVGVGEDAQAFPTALVAAIHDSCRQVIRVEGDPRSPEETLARRAGSCRDLTVLFNAIARSAGFAARFVSGYWAAPSLDRFELHAWSELYLPGGGWRGFDPSAGLAVSDRHVAVASGPRPKDAAPLSGAYYGTDVSAKLAANVDIQVLSLQSQQLGLPY